jgi:hypothetical protein
LFGIQTKYKELQKYRIKSSHRSCVSKKCAIPLTEALSNRSNFYDLLDINSKWFNKALIREVLMKHDKITSHETEKSATKIPQHYPNDLLTTIVLILSLQWTSVSGTI